MAFFMFILAVFMVWKGSGLIAFLGWIILFLSALAVINSIMEYSAEEARREASDAEGARRAADSAAASQGSAEREEQFELQAPAMFAELSKPIYKEEFPDHASMFTTITCMKIYGAGREVLCKHLNVNSMPEALMKLEEMGQEAAEEVEKQTEEEHLSALPDDIEELLRKDKKLSDKFGDATGAALVATLGEFSKNA